MKYFILVALFCATLFANELNWSHDYDKALKNADKSGKLVYVLITSDNCRWCRKFESTTLQDKTILKRLYKEFEVVHISRDQNKVPKGFETSPVPRHYFTNAKGDILYNSLGHRATECFDAFMDNAEDKVKSSK